MGFRPWRAHAIPPTRWSQIRFWAIPLERGDIFQHKGHAMLAYLEDRLQVAPKMAQDANLTPTWPILGPTWPNLGSSWPHLEPPRDPKRPPRGPKRPKLHHKNWHFVWERAQFSSYPLACNMSPLGRRRGPALRAEYGGGSSQCQIPLGLIKEQ